MFNLGFELGVEDWSEDSLELGLDMDGTLLVRFVLHVLILLFD